MVGYHADPDLDERYPSSIRGSSGLIDSHPSSVAGWLHCPALRSIFLASLGRRNAERSADGNAARYSKVPERLRQLRDEPSWIAGRKRTFGTEYLKYSEEDGIRISDSGTGTEDHLDRRNSPCFIP